MKTALSFIMACVLVLFATETVAANADSKLELRIEQNGKTVKPNAEGVTKLRRATFTVVFVFKSGTQPPVKFNLSFNRNNYDGIWTGMKPDTFVFPGMGMAEGHSPPPDDDLCVAFGSDHPEGMHFLIPRRFHHCEKSKDANILTCKRVVKKLTILGYPGGKKIIKTFNLTDFSSEPVYLSAAVVKKPSTPCPNGEGKEGEKKWRAWLQEYELLGATAIIQFE